MNRSNAQLLSLLLGLMSLFCSCTSIDKVKELSTQEHISQRYDLALEQHLKQFQSISIGYTHMNSRDTSVPKNLVLIGHKLYYDKLLSGNGQNSCNSCHNLATFGVDNKMLSLGFNGSLLYRNTPTILNATLDTLQFWDGRASSLEAQIQKHVLNSSEMGLDGAESLLKRLQADSDYTKLFAKAYPQSKGISLRRVTTALVAFEKQLYTPSRFDLYLDGNTNALSIEEKRGLLSFINVGCIQCHSGAALGGNIYEKFGVFKNYWELTNSQHIDSGRVRVTGNTKDRYVFKVPTLRNITKTSPYFHDGSVKDLKLAVKIMAQAQLNYKLSDEELHNILAYLNSLTAGPARIYQHPPVILNDGIITPTRP